MNFKKIADSVLVFGAFSLAFVYSLRRMSDTDIWAHLKCGEYFFEKGAILRTHYFNCSWPDFPYLNHEWLFQAIIYKVYYYFGEAGIVTLQVLLVLLSFFILYKILRLYTGNMLIIALILAAGVVSSSHRFVLRPQHFSYVFLLYFLFSLHMYQRGNTRYAWFMPLVMIAWVNIHAESLWGIVVPAVFIAAEYIRTFRIAGADKGSLRRIVLIFGLVLAASMLNPFGYKTVFWPFFVMKEQFAGVEEILPPFEFRYVTFWFYSAMFVVSLMLNARRADRTWLTLSLIFCAVAWTANRGIPHFIFISAPLVAANLEAVLPGYRSEKKAALCIAAGVRTFLFVYILWIIFSVTTHPLFLKKYDNVPYPEGALQFMKTNGVKGNVFNHHPWGGYIIWNAYPELKPYIDGRFFRKKFYDEFRHILSVGAGWQEILAKYNIAIVLLPYSETDKGTLSDRLFSSLHWRLVYWDDVSLLYLKDTPENMKVIGRSGNSIINPDRQLYDYSETSPELIEKANALAEGDLLYAPRSHKASLLSADTFFQKGDYRMAAKRYEESLDPLTHKNAWIYYRLALSYRYAGDLNKSAGYAEKCLAAAPDSREAAQFLNELKLLQQSE